jgi:gamma-glutamylaminecyclotransferase
MTTIFVYGTLKRGYCNWQRLLRERATFLGEAVSLAKDFHMVGSGFPIMWEGPDGSYVKGELFELPDDVLEQVDRLEGHPRWYLRQPRKFFNRDTGRVVTAEVYLQNGLDRRHGQPIEPKHYHVEWNYNSRRI